MSEIDELNAFIQKHGSNIVISVQCDEKNNSAESIERNELNIDITYQAVSPTVETR